MNDAHDLELLLRSRFPLIVIETFEEARVLSLLEKLANLNQWSLFAWSAADGLYRRAWQREFIPDCQDPALALRHIAKTPQNGVFALLDFHPYLKDPVHTRLIKNIAQDYAVTARTLIFISHQLELPAELRGLSARFTLAMPDRAALNSMIEEEAAIWAAQNDGGRVKVQREALELLIDRISGLCHDDAKRMIRRAIEDDGAIRADDIPKIAAARNELMNAEGLLSFEIETANAKDIGGLNRLKQWLLQRQAAFSGKLNAKLDTPKGILIVGVQGGGKSLAAKAVAGMWNLPLLRLDFGSLYNKFHGESERNLREALKTAERMAPCILWLDEIEKGLAQDSSDDGVSRRLLATWLTWLAERRARVFVVATANDIQALPPELIRKGRLDEIFFVDLPDEETRVEIFRIHSARRDIPVERFDLKALAQAAEGFSGAEIEQALVAALYQAHNEQSPLANRHVLEELARTRPLSVVMAEKLTALRVWAQDRTVMAN